MPPAAFIAVTAGVQAIDRVAFTTPSAVKTRDTLLAIIASIDPDEAQVVDMPEGWEQLAEFPLLNGIITILRREVVDEEPPTHEVALVADPFVVAALIAYRGLDANSPMLEATATAINASTNFVCPSRTLTTYSELYLGLVFVSASVAITHPAGTTERYDANGAGPSRLQIFELLPELVGATGTKTSTVAAPQSGVAASALFKVQATPLVQSLVPDVPGAIGFVEVGV